jgi:cell division protease FtsH
MEIKREHQIHFWYIIAAFLALMLIQDLLYQPTHIKTIPYSEFQQLADQGKVTDIVVGPTTITGTYKASEVQVKPPAGQAAPPAEPQHFQTYRVPPELADRLTKDKLPFSGEAPPGFLATALGWILPSVGFVLLWVFLVRRMAGQGTGGLMSVGKSKAKVFVEKDTKTTFADVAGVDEAKEELREVVSFLKDPASYGRLGAHVPKGVLLVGREDAARPCGRRRSGRELFLDLGLGIRRNVRGRGGGARARPLRASAPARAGHCLRRRARCAGARSRHFPAGRRQP